MKSILIALLLAPAAQAAQPKIIDLMPAPKARLSDEGRKPAARAMNQKPAEKAEKNATRRKTAPRRAAAHPPRLAKAPRTQM